MSRHYLNANSPSNSANCSAYTRLWGSSPRGELLHLWPDTVPPLHYPSDTLYYSELNYINITNNQYDYYI